MSKSLRYGLIALTLSACSLAGCKDKKEVIPASEHLQVYQQRYDQYFGEHKVSLDSARTKLSDACLDGVITADEQKAILEDFNRARLARENFRKNLELAPERASLYLDWPEHDEKTFSLLDENINGFDGFTPNLQGYLQSRGTNVKVQDYKSGAEVAAEVTAEILTSIIQAISDD